MEHWLPLFYQRMDTLFDSRAARAPLMLGHHIPEEAKGGPARS